MSANPLILIGVPITILDGVSAIAAGPTFALPARSVVLAWQTSYDVAPGAVNITLRVSIDGIVWTVLDTSTAVGGEVRTVTVPTAAIFVDVNLVTNTGGHLATVVLVAKVAVP